MRTFDYHRPESLSDAAALLRASPETKPLAGGMTLIPALKLRLATPSAVVDLSAITELQGSRVSKTEVAIGAMTRHVQIERSSEIRAAIPALCALAGMIGDPQVRNRGTIGGSIANNDPSADYPAAVLALNATITTDKRTIAAGDFFSGMFQTALLSGEIIKSVTFPIPSAAAYEKFRSPASRYALVGVFIAKTNSGVRVAVTGAAPCVFRASAIETALKEKFAPEALANIRISADGLNSDMHADAQYRAHLIGVLARRAMTSIAGATKH